jgi:hypothetical protein
MLCSAIYSCPTAGQGYSHFEFKGNLKQTQNQGGALSFTVTNQYGLWVDPNSDETISVFPEDIPVGWIATKNVNAGWAKTVCLITWTLSIQASMSGPGSLSFTDLQTHQIKETCGKRCSTPITKFCTYTPAPITKCV